MLRESDGNRSCKGETPEQNTESVICLSQSVEIDDNSAARVQKLLLISNLVSNFPLFIVGLGVIMLLILIVLLVKARRQKVRGFFTSLHSFTAYMSLALL